MTKRLLCIGALGFYSLLIAPLHGAVVSLVAEGIVSDTFSQGADFGRVGEPFQISISYQSDLEDEDPTDFFGQYFDDDLTVTLEFPESGRMLQGMGGSINVNSILGPDGSIFVSEIFILSGLPELGAFFFLFQDEDGSEISDTNLPIQFSRAEDYDFVGFSVLDLSLRTGGTRPIPPLIAGEVTLVSIPEPSSILLVFLSGSMLLRRKR